MLLQFSDQSQASSNEDPFAEETVASSKSSSPNSSGVAITTPRDYAFGGMLSFGRASTTVSTTTASTSSSAINFSAVGQAIKNFGWFEVGPTAALSWSKPGGGDATASLSIGVLAEINFVKNIAPEAFVPGLDLSAEYSRSSGIGAFELGFGAIAKLFVSHDTAIRLRLGYDRASSSIATISTTVSNIGLSIGMQKYF
jgi:hypothetical protein